MDRSSRRSGDKQLPSKLKPFCFPVNFNERRILEQTAPIY
jgi:hypothetical protein